MNTLKTFEELEVWKAAREMRLKIARLAKQFPAAEQYRLTDQILRSSRSVAANIAEGFGRFHHKENLQYCRQARGSLSETSEHLTCAYDEGYIDKATLLEHRDCIKQCWKILNGYISYLSKTSKHL